jgi:DNA-binding MurR/RpiR family transcriptional regulator
MLFGENIFRISDSCEKVAKVLADANSMMILGKGASGAIAKYINIYHF